MPQLTPKEYAALLQKLDAVCRQAQELSKQLRAEMVSRARSYYPERQGQPERRAKERKRR